MEPYGISRIWPRTPGRAFSWLVLFCLALILSLGGSRPGAAMHAGLTSPTAGLYLADGNASPGAVYRLESDGSLTTYYTRPAGPLTHFTFSPAGDLYYLDANGNSIYRSTPDGEQLHFTHTTYVSDLAFGADGLLYFSDAFGGGDDGHIWRLVGGFAGWVPELFYTVSPASVNGYWGGDFAFDSAGTLYLSNGNRSPASLYRRQPDGTLQQIYQQDDELDGFAVDATGAFYFTTRAGGIYQWVSGEPRALIWSIPAGRSVWDINLAGRVGPTPAPTQTPTATRPPANTPTSTATASPTQTSTATTTTRPSPTATWTRTPTSTSTATPSPTATATTTATRGVTPTPTATPTTALTAPKWLEAPALDGRCNDPAYDQAGSVSLQTLAGGPGAGAKLLHSALDFYVCFSDIPAATGENVVVRVDPDHSRSRLLMPGDYRFSVDAAGQISVTQGTTAGLWEPISVPAGDFAAVVTPATFAGAWDAELRISLEWMGGYARTDGLSLAVEQAGGAVLQQWPPTAAAQSPATWGNLVLAPLYPDTVTAESAFLDGREGYLVVPYAADLNPAEITIEAWVRVVDGDCGALVGNGRDVSYWLAICRMIQFGHDGAGLVETGQHPLGDGWRHVAVTMDAVKGIRTFYLDGQVDARFGWEPAEEKRPGEEEEPERLGVSDRMLRIGSDRDAPDEVDHLHGYVSELRIWSRVRSAAEIQADAFRRLSGAEEGLVALWPFTHGLQDIAGGHDAGLVGNASLAREGRDVESFPPIPTPVPYTYPTPEPISAWTHHVAATTGDVTLDGVCRPAEYPDESKVVLEPDRSTSMRLLLTRDSLYLCTNIIWGGNGLDSAVTLWINRDGQGGAAPGPADLRLRLLPDGALEVGTGDGRGYNGPPPTVFASQIISDTLFALQEDIHTVNSPWWAGEVRIPLEALAPYASGQPLRLALSSEGTIAAGALPDQPEETTVMGGWPASFDPQRPDTWGEASTEKPPHNLYLPLVSRQYTGPRSAEVVGHDASSGDASNAGGLIMITPSQAEALRAQQPSALAGWPRPAPAEGDFNSYCPEWAKPAYAFDKDYKWPRVDPQNFPVVQAEGTLDEINISKEDSPFIHNSHDLDMKATVRQEDRWLVLGGGASLVLETESGPFRQDAIPVLGDHVTVQGRWIFDCGHAPKTEIHPIPIFESDRLVTLPDGIGVPGNRKTVRVARVWMNSHPGAFSYTFGGPFTFSVALPAAQYGGDKLLFIRVVHGPANKVAVTGLSNTTAQITITPPGSSGQYYFELVLGYLDTPNPASAAGMGYTVTLNKIWIYDDHDAGLPDCHGLNDCGEWTMFVALNDTWRKVFVNKTVWDEHDHADYAVNVSIPVFGNDLRLRVIGYEDDDPFAGDWITRLGNESGSSEYNHGSLASLCCEVQQSAWHNDWRIFYTVHNWYDGLTALPANDSLYWMFRLSNEPNDPIRDDLGTLPVPDEGAPAHVTEKNAYLTQSPLQKNGVYVLKNDVDRYKFTLADFADVTFGNLPYGVHVHVDQTFPWTYSGNLPQNLADMLGYKSAWINVHGDQPAVTDQQYTLKVYTSWRTLPPDWGEDQEQGRLVHGGRLVDLVTPDPAATVIDQWGFEPARRYLTKDWAWQHVQGDIDYYDVWIPPVQTRPPGQPVCKFDRDGKLEIRAYDMHLRAGTSYLSGDAVAEADNSITLTNLNTQFPDGHVYVRVGSITGRRGLYRLRAEWVDGRYFAPDECQMLLAAEALKNKLLGESAINWQSVYVPQLDLPDPPPFSDAVTLYGLGGYEEVALAQAGTLDTIVSSAAGQPVAARLYDANGVMVAEGTPLGEESAGARVLDGQIPQSRLTVGGLQAGETYFMQIVPAFDVGPAGMQEISVGFTQ